MRICLGGATGRVGRQLAAAILNAGDLTLDSALARRAVGQDIGVILGGKPTDVLISDDLDAALARRPDVLIDYTHPSAIFASTMAAIRRSVGVVVGTSGLTGAELGEIDQAARAAGVGVATGNFSLTAALLQHLARIACQHAPHWEVLEYNQAEKPDAPSGTAMELAEQLSALRRPEIALPVSQTYGHPEARGADIDGTRVHAVRLPGFASACEVVFGLPGERLTLRHEMLGDDSIFVAGTLLAARRIRSLSGVVRGLDKLLFGNRQGAAPAGRAPRARNP